MENCHFNNCKIIKAEKLNSAKSSLISIAEIESLESFNFPKEVSLKDNPDLIGVIFRAANINVANRNGECINQKTAIEIGRKFVHKPINIGHKKEKVVGFIVGYGWSELNGEEITEEQAAEKKDPFDLIIKAVIWGYVNQKIAVMLADASDPESDFYESLSASWELGFSKYSFYKGDRNPNFGLKITDQEDFDRLSRMRKAKVLTDPKDGQDFFRQIESDEENYPVIPLGIAITERPAAFVKGILMVDPEKNDSEEKNFPNTSISDVSKDTKIMKVKTIQELLKIIPEDSHASVKDFFEEGLKKTAAEYEAKNKEKTEALENAKASLDAQSREIEALKSEMQKLVSQAEKEQSERKFSERMSHLDEVFELDANDRKVIASEISHLDEKGFESWIQKFEVIAAAKNKKKIAEEKEKFEKAVAEAVKKKMEEEKEKTPPFKKEDGYQKKKEEKKMEKSEASQDFEKVLQNLTEDGGQEISNASSPDVEKVVKKWTDLFSIGGRKK